MPYSSRCLTLPFTSRSLPNLRSHWEWSRQVTPLLSMLLETWLVGTSLTLFSGDSYLPCNRYHLPLLCRSLSLTPSFPFMWHSFRSFPSTLHPPHSAVTPFLLKGAFFPYYLPPCFPMTPHSVSPFSLSHQPVPSFYAAYPFIHSIFFFPCAPSRYSRPDASALLLAAL